MLLNFEKVIMHNFLSYGHSEIELTNKGYCIVTGENRFKPDNSASNGSGKSTWSSAICWALTGETIKGVSTHIKNDLIDEDLCYVELYFNCDGNSYVIKRLKAPKSDLKITLNGKDISGKGLRESEAVLGSYLPDLTSSLIASIIILGQGLPQKFSNNTPSGRKDVLEKLSKSDYMIDDLKEKLNNRLSVLNTSLREYQDKNLEYTSKKTLTESYLEQEKNHLGDLVKPIDFDEVIGDLKKQIFDLDIITGNVKDSLETYQNKIDNIMKYQKELIENKSSEIDNENKDFNDFTKQYLDKKYKIDSDKKIAEKELNRLESITDVCPTCGQKIPGAKKPDTTEQKKLVESLDAQLAALNSKYSEASALHQEALSQIQKKYSANIAKWDKDLENTRIEKKQVNDIYDDRLSLRNKKAEDLTKIEAKKAGYLNEKQRLESLIESYESSVKKLQDDILYNKSEADKISERIDVLNKTNTLLKRDFRGFLLSNVIEFIDSKVKEYANDIFGHTEIAFRLDGNNIEIEYCGKPLENLSGGEAQKVDLIIQFAIRDMMTQYLDFRCNIIVLDEVFDQLDMKSCNALLNFISHKLNDIESIFIISHRASELEIPCDTDMQIEKDEKGISRVK